MLKHRLTSASLLIGAMVVVVFCRSIWTSGLFVILTCTGLVLALREFFELARKIGYAGYQRLTRVAGVLMGIMPFALQQCGKIDHLHLLEPLVFLGFITGGLIESFRSDNPKRAFSEIAVSLFGFVYLAWTMSFIPRIYFLDHAGGNGPYLLFFLVLVTKAADIGGYTLGMTTARLPGGNHKMVPALSPGKSWEGLVGGVLFSVATACLLVYFMGDRLFVADRQIITITGAVLIGVCCTLLGLVGDLSESLIKRAAGEKDSGASIPGMGGMLDVVDSLILVGPLFYCLLHLA